MLHETCAESADKPIIHECITECAEKYIYEYKASADAAVQVKLV